MRMSNDKVRSIIDKRIMHHIKWADRVANTGGFNGENLLDGIEWVAEDIELAKDLGVISGRDAALLRYNWYIGTANRLKYEDWKRTNDEYKKEEECDY